MPGSFVGSFSVNGTLLPTGVTAPGVPVTTTCQVVVCCPLADGGQACGPDVQVGASCTTSGNGDGGGFAPTPTVAFYGYLSQDVDGGVAYWEIQGGPLQDGGLVGASFQVSLQSSAPLQGCGCVAGLVETTLLAQALADGGTGTVFGSPYGSFDRGPDGGPDGGPDTAPVPALRGWLDDRLVPDPSQQPVCPADAGMDSGCVLDCDLVYVLTAVPGQPGF